MAYEGMEQLLDELFETMRQWGFAADIEDVDARIVELRGRIDLALDHHGGGSDPTGATPA